MTKLPTEPKSTVIKKRPVYSGGAYDLVTLLRRAALAIRLFSVAVELLPVMPNSDKTVHTKLLCMLACVVGFGLCECVVFDTQLKDKNPGDGS